MQIGENKIMNIPLNIVICDDDKNFVEKIYDTVVEVLDENNYKYNIVEFYGSDELIEYCEENKNTDILLADIDMPDMNGFDAVKYLQKSQPEIAVIFVSAHEEMALQSFAYSPYQFVSKRDMGRLTWAMENLAKKVYCRKLYGEVIHMEFNNKVYHINVKDTLYFKGKRNYVEVHRMGGETEEIRISLKSVYDKVKDLGFIYVQRSYIVNCRLIRDFNSKEVLMSDGSKISVTRSSEKRKEAQIKYGKFMRELRW